MNIILKEAAINFCNSESGKKKRAVSLNGRLSKSKHPRSYSGIKMHFNNCTKSGLGYFKYRSDSGREMK